ncbi:DUF2938 family protein [Candidatus Acetothermia bacterium]|nr:DUF2938 family protein [Candidatus Acetothermia bacterium]
MNINWLKAIVAGMAGTAVMTVVAMMAGPMMGVDMNVPQMLSGFMNLPIAVGWVAHFMIGTVLALIYAIVFVGFLPGPPVARGALYGLAPFLLAQIMVMPMMGAGLFSSGMGDKAMAAVMGSLIGHLLYGAIVGGIYGRQESSITVTPQKAR